MVSSNTILLLVTLASVKIFLCSSSGVLHDQQNLHGLHRHPKKYLPLKPESFSYTEILKDCLADTFHQHYEEFPEKSLHPRICGSLSKSPNTESSINVPSTIRKIMIASNGILSRKRREESAVIYIPVPGTGSGANCPTLVDAAAIGISQMTFLSLCLGLFTAVANIINNINNNNRRNNNNNDNNINSNNVNIAANANTGNQITVQLPPPSRKRRENDVERAMRLGFHHLFKIFHLNYLDWKDSEEKKRKKSIRNRQL